MKAEYQSRIQALEARLAQLEAQAAAPPAAVAEAPVAPPAPSAGGGGAGNAFNPAVSVILGGRYTQTSADPSSYAIAGFVPAGEGSVRQPQLHLDESELTLAANIDPYFFGNLTASIERRQLRSAWRKPTSRPALPAGCCSRVERFFSGIGYLNEIHSHAWDFVDQPLVYQAMFDAQLAQDGVQLKWLAPTDMFLEFGAESATGRSRHAPCTATASTASRCCPTSAMTSAIRQLAGGFVVAVAAGRGAPVR